MSGLVLLSALLACDRFCRLMEMSDLICHNVSRMDSSGLAVTDFVSNVIGFARRIDRVTEKGRAVTGVGI